MSRAIVGGEQGHRRWPVLICIMLLAYSEIELGFELRVQLFGDVRFDLYLNDILHVQPVLELDGRPTLIFPSFLRHILQLVQEHDDHVVFKEAGALECADDVVVFL